MTRKPRAVRLARSVATFALLVLGAASTFSQSPPVDSTASPAAQSSSPVPAKLKRIRYAAPQYPAQASKYGISGYVTIAFVVNERGEPTNLQVVDQQPALLFDQAAKAAVSRWRYEPLRVNNAPAQVATRTTVRFELLAKRGINDTNSHGVGCSPSPHRASRL